MQKGKIAERQDGLQPLAGRPDAAIRTRKGGDTESGSELEEVDNKSSQQKRKDKKSKAKAKDKDKYQDNDQDKDQYKEREQQRLPR